MNHVLRKAMGYTFQMAKDSQEAASGKVEVKKTEYAHAAADGVAWADKVQKVALSESTTGINLLIHVVEEYGSLEESIAFHDAYKLRSEKLSELGTAVEQTAGRSALQYAAWMKRCLWAVYGKPEKNEDGKIVPNFGKPEKGMTHIKGKTAVLGLLKGAGTRADKVKSLPRFTNRGAPKQSLTGEEAIQKRYKDVESLPPTGDTDVLARVLGVPKQVDGKDLTDTKRQAIAQAQITAAIRAMDDGKIEPVLYACAHRCRLSSEWAPMGTAILKAMEEVMNRTLPAPKKPARTLHKADAKK